MIYTTKQNSETRLPKDMQLIFHTLCIQLPKHFLEICPSLSKILLMYPRFVHVNYC